MSNDAWKTSVYHSSNAKNNFEIALSKGVWRSVIHWILQKNNDLLEFDEVRKLLPLKGQHDLGNKVIELSNIVGSVSRYHDFDRAFLPKRVLTKHRWMSIDQAYMEDINLPPIEVYKVGGVYFVKDGNHRVSVARERGQTFIDAYVIEIDVAVPIDKNSDIEELIQKKERIDFQESTCLQELRPDANIQPSIPGGYLKILEHIQVHRWYLGVKLKKEVPCSEAAASWYDEVYLPLVMIIRENGILKTYHNRTETDLYVWIIEHLYYLREKYQKATMEEATLSFRKKRPNRAVSQLLNIFNNLFSLINKDTPDSANPN